jgi:hypothetical protein
LFNRVSHSGASAIGGAGAPWIDVIVGRQAGARGAGCGFEVDQDLDNHVGYQNVTHMNV